MLEPIVDSLESIPEDRRGLYREGTEDEGAKGKYVLGVKRVSGWSLENTEKLRNALALAKDERRQAKDALKAFEGLDADEVRAKLDKLGKLEEGGTPDEKSRLEAAVAAARREAEAKWASKLSEVEKKSTAKDGEIERLSKGAEIERAIAHHKGKAHLLRPLLNEATRVEWVDGKTHLKVLNPETGLARISQEGEGDMTLEEYVKTLKGDEQFADCFLRDSPQSGPGVSDAPKNRGRSPAVSGDADVLDKNPLARLSRYHEAKLNGGAS